MFWIALILSVLGILLPVITLIEGLGDEYLFNVLSSFGILMYILGVISIFFAAQNAPIGDKSRKFGFASFLLLLFPYIAIRDRISDYNTFFFTIASEGMGSYAILVAMILSFVASLSVKNTLLPPKKFRQAAYRPSQFQQPYQQPLPKQYQETMQEPPAKELDSSFGYDMFCSNCGVKGISSDKFCKECGNSMV